jgi:glycosyltransferase involved in cell wall biosynthesis
MKSMADILVLNNYPLDQVWDEVKRGEKPDHHLFGINYFAKRGHEVKIIPFQNSSQLQYLNRFLTRSHFPIPLGDLDQQWSTFRLLNKADLIYSPCQTQTHLLAYLRALGIIRVPIVALAYGFLNTGRLSWLRSPMMKLLFQGTDAFPCLSSKGAKEFNRIAGQSSKSQALQWGPDASFYPASSGLGQGVVAAGRTGRDFVTLGLAASRTNVPTHIVCLQDSVSEAFQTFGENVKVSIQPNQEHMKYPQLLELYARARVLAIPTVESSVVALGITSLMDALAMGKPVIMTRTPLIDLDIEAEGVGKWVNPGDIEGWSQAIQFFHDHEDEADAMGKRARRLVEAGINSESFANQVMDIFDEVLTCASSGE